MNFKAILSNRTHPGYGQVTVYLPIPDSEYDHTIGLLEGMGIGSPTAQDCRVDELDGPYPILNRLVTQIVNVDELDFVGASFISLASAFGESSLISLLLLSKSKPLRWVSIWLPLKQLDSFSKGEDEKFEAMASKLCLSDIKDFINLTFCCQQATSSGQASYPSLPPSAKARSFRCPSSPNRTRCAGLRFGFFPPQRTGNFQSGAGVVTPYGVVYDNGMSLEPLYDGRHFPAYLHGTPEMMLEIRSGADSDTTGYLYLPCSDKQIQRTLERAGCGPEGYQMAVAIDELPPKVSAIVSPTRDSIDDINALCRAVGPLSTEGREKLDAVVLLARPKYASEVRQLAIAGAPARAQRSGSRGERRSSEMSELCRLRLSERYGACDDADQFAFMPKPFDPEADCAITELGYVAYHGSLTLEELMMENPAEQYQQEQEMGGMA